MGLIVKGNGSPAIVSTKTSMFTEFSAKENEIRLCFVFDLLSVASSCSNHIYLLFDFLQDTKLFVLPAIGVSGLFSRSGW